jgi:hypothetical protein
VTALQVLGKKDVELGVKDRLSVDQFAAAWSSLGVSISHGYVNALFNKYGHNARGNMPVMVRGRRKGSRCAWWGC